MTTSANPAAGGSHLITLLVAILSIVAWALLAFVFPVGVGAVHLLLGLGVALLVRYWALKA